MTDPFDLFQEATCEISCGNRASAERLLGLAVAIGAHDNTPRDTLAAMESLRASLARTILQESTS